VGGGGGGILKNKSCKCTSVQDKIHGHDHYRKKKDFKHVQ